MLWVFYLYQKKINKSKNKFAYNKFIFVHLQSKTITNKIMKHTKELLETLANETLIRIILKYQNDCEDLENELSDKEIEMELLKENVKDLKATVDYLKLISKSNLKSEIFTN